MVIKADESKTWATPTASRSRSLGTCLLKVPSLWSQGGKSVESIVENNDSCKHQIPCFLHSSSPTVPSIYDSTGDRPLTGLGQKTTVEESNA